MTPEERRYLVIDVTQKPEIERMIVNGLRGIAPLEVQTCEVALPIPYHPSEWLTEEDLRVFTERNHQKWWREKHRSLFEKLLMFNSEASFQHTDSTFPAIDLRLEIDQNRGEPAIHAASVLELSQDEEALRLVRIGLDSTGPNIIHAWADELLRTMPGLLSATDS